MNYRYLILSVALSLVTQSPTVASYSNVHMDFGNNNNNAAGTPIQNVPQFTDEELNRYETLAGNQGIEMGMLLFKLKDSLTNRPMTSERSQLFQHIIQYSLSGHNRIAQAVRPLNHQGPVLPRHLTPASLRIMKCMTLQNVMQYGIDLAPRFGIEVTGDSPEYRLKLTGIIIKKIKAMLKEDNEPTPEVTHSPQYQPTPGTTDQQPNPYETKPYEYQPYSTSDEKASFKGPISDPSDEEIRKHEKMAMSLCDRIMIISTQLALSLKMRKNQIPQDRIELCQWIVNYVFSKNEEIAQIVKPGHIGPMLPGTLNETQLEQVRVLSRRHIVQFGEDIAPKLGMEATPITIPAKLKLTGKVLERLEKMIAEFK